MRLYEEATARYASANRKGRCVSCGFLAKHRARWHEADDSDRVNGNFDQGGYGWTPETTDIACFRHAANLAEERLKAGGGSAGALMAINMDRNCPEWYPYTPGFTPQEHFEEWRMIQLEQERQKHDLALAQLQQEADKRSQAIAEQLRLTTEATSRFTTKWTYVAVAIAVAALLFVAAGYLFPDLGRQLGHSIAPALASPSGSPTH